MNFGIIVFLNNFQQNMIKKSEPDAPQVTNPQDKQPEPEINTPTPKKAKAKPEPVSFALGARVRITQGR